MTIQEMKDRKFVFGLTNQRIAEAANLPVCTVQRIFAGETKAPRQDTLLALNRAIRMLSAEHIPSFTLRESPLPYQAKVQGEYTVDDYYALPEDRRVELIDGVIYDMTAPSALHQQILGQLHLQFQACAAAHEGCDVFLAPCDVQLDRDQYTMIQPDLFVICRDYDRHARALAGAPDLVVEILSPSTRAKDMLKKLDKYKHAGVLEYWIVDPEHLRVHVYNFSIPDFTLETFTFDDWIPIHLSKGACGIDFKIIHQKINAFLPPP